MSHIRLFPRPKPRILPPLGLEGVMVPYDTLLAYETRLDIINQIGDCTVEILSSSNLPPGAQVWVDNPNQQVVIAWPQYSPPASQDIPNGAFEAGNDGNWKIHTGWDIGAFGESGTLGARFKKFRGTFTIDSNSLWPVVLGQEINITARVDQGGNPPDVTGSVALAFYDTNRVLIEKYYGTEISSGVAGTFVDSTLTQTAPADGFVQAFVRGKRGDVAAPLYVDSVSWDYEGPAGPDNADEICLGLRITDSAHRTADWAGCVEAIWDYAKPTLWTGKHRYTGLPDAMTQVTDSAYRLQTGSSTGQREIAVAADGSVIALRYYEDGSNLYYFFRWDEDAVDYVASPITGYQSITTGQIKHAISFDGQWIATVHLNLPGDEIRIYTYKFDGTGYTYQATLSYTSVFSPLALSFSPDGLSLAAFHQEAGGQLKVWSLDVETGELSLVFSVASGLASFSCDWFGDFILGADGNGGLVRVYNDNNGTIKGTITHSDDHFGAYFSSDGLWIYSLCGDQIHVYSFDPGSGSIAHDNSVTIGHEPVNFTISSDRKFIFCGPTFGGIDFINNAVFQCSGNVLTALPSLPEVDAVTTWTNLQAYPF